MNFSSIPFAAFFIIVFAAYWSMSSMRGRHLLLLVSSYVFYMTWNPWLVLLIIGSTVLDYAIGFGLGNVESQGWRKALLVGSIAGNIGVLGLFKYADFFIESFGEMVSLLGFRADVRTLGLILPVGISFYTFQTLSYTIDVYRRRIDPERSFLRFAVFVAFFPQLVAGPIVKAREFLPQLLSPKRFDWSRVDSGMILILVGLTKKVLIADNLAGVADEVFAAPDRFTTADLWLGMFCYAGQIYGDFSGYSDMAIGFARLLGFDLCDNFASPYLATSLTGFWHRWHISLSTWLRDYLYIPLGGSHGTRWQTARNLMLTMLLGGLWHGASWTFVVWGAIHGAALVMHKAWRWTIGSRKTDGRGANIGYFGTAFSWAMTLLVVCIAWVFFRCQPVTDAAGVTESAFAALSRAGYFVSHLVVQATPTDAIWLMDKWPMVILLGLLASIQLYEEWLRRGRPSLRLPAVLAGPSYAAWVLLLVIYRPENTNPFIYFQF